MNVARDGASERTAADDETELSVRAEENIEAWEKKRAAERGSEAGDDLSDDAEAGGP